MSIIVAIMINERAKHFIIAVSHKFDSILVNSFASTIVAAL
jgi:hypothetical protein